MNSELSAKTASFPGSLKEVGWFGPGELKALTAETKSSDRVNRHPDVRIQKMVAGLVETRGRWWERAETKRHGAL